MFNPTVQGESSQKSDSLATWAPEIWGLTKPPWHFAGHSFPVPPAARCNSESAPGGVHKDAPPPAGPALSDCQDDRGPLASPSSSPAADLDQVIQARALSLAQLGFCSLPRVNSATKLEVKVRATGARFPYCKRQANHLVT